MPGFTRDRCNCSERTGDWHYNRFYTSFFPEGAALENQTQEGVRLNNLAFSRYKYDCPYIRSKPTKSLRQFLVCSNVTEKNLVEGLNGEGGGSKCQLSVKFLAICQLSVFFSAICQLSVKFTVVSK